MTIGAMRGQPGTMLARTAILSSHPVSATQQIKAMTAIPIRDSSFKVALCRVMSLPWRMLWPVRRCSLRP